MTQKQKNRTKINIISELFPEFLSGLTKIRKGKKYFHQNDKYVETQSVGSLFFINEKTSNNLGFIIPKYYYSPFDFEPIKVLDFRFQNRGKHFSFMDKNVGFRKTKDSVGGIFLKSMNWKKYLNNDARPN